MPTYNYVFENGTTTSTITSFKWQSLCHKEDVMDGCKMLVETGGFAWSVCRLCGKEAYFIKAWPEGKETYDQVLLWI